MNIPDALTKLLNNPLNMILIRKSTLKVSEQVAPFQVLQDYVVAFRVLVDVMKLDHIGVTASLKNIYFIQLQDEFFTLEAFLIDLLNSNRFPIALAFALEDATIGSLPKNCVPQLKFVLEVSHVASLLKPLHPYVALVKALQEEDALIYLT